MWGVAFHTEAYWDLIKHSFCKREMIEETGTVEAMRSYMVFGFPIETEDKEYSNL